MVFTPKQGMLHSWFECLLVWILASFGLVLATMGSCLGIGICSFSSWFLLMLLFFLACFSVPVAVCSLEVLWFVALLSVSMVCWSLLCSLAWGVAAFVLFGAAVLYSCRLCGSAGAYSC